MQCFPTIKLNDYDLQFQLFKKTVAHIFNSAVTVVYFKTCNALFIIMAKRCLHMN